MAKHRYKEAAAILKRAAKFNSVHLSSEPFPNKDVQANGCVAGGDNESFHLNKTVDNSSEDTETRHYTVCDMFRTPGLCRRSLVLFYVW